VTSDSAVTRVLSIDDDRDIRDLLERVLRGAGYDVVSAAGGAEGLQLAGSSEPDIILLDVMMPDMNGYEVCEQLQSDPRLAAVPVIFLTALGSAEDRGRAFASGGVDYLTKPFTPDRLVTAVMRNLETAVRWEAIPDAETDAPGCPPTGPVDFRAFKGFLAARLPATDAVLGVLDLLRPESVFDSAPRLGIAAADMATLLAEFMCTERIPAIDPDEIDLGALPAAFCRSRQVVPVLRGGKPGLVVANPFDWELVDTVARFSKTPGPYAIYVAEPEAIDSLLAGAAERGVDPAREVEHVHRFGAAPAQMDVDDIDAGEVESAIDSGPVTSIANNMVAAAASQRASDIHIEPKESNAVVRFRVDGDMRDFITLKRRTAVMLISRLKALAGLDIAERRRPQDGSLEAVVQDHRFKLRLATTSTPHGESLIVRMLEVTQEPKALTELGLTEEQSATLRSYAARPAGMVLVVGGTGSGKTTTIYSLLSQVDAERRSIITIEDPVEYLIPLANQQQVNEKGGVTFESLLRSVVRQDPDVLFLGEVRDAYSAKTSLDFASTGHLTITTMHTANATTALFRLERLGVARSAMAEAIVAIVAQRLVKRLCPACRRIEPISVEERAWLAPFTDDIPKKVAHPAGCTLCGGTGYAGREAVVEIFAFDPVVQDMIRRDIPAPEIRDFVRRRGDYLIHHHAISKVRDHTFTPKDAFERVLAEEWSDMSRADAMRAEALPAPVEAAAPPAARSPESKPKKSPKPAPAAPARAAARAKTGTSAVLVVDALALALRSLEGAGYKVASAPDGAAALVELGRQTFDLVIADVEMPILDGWALLGVMRSQKIATPLILLTGSTQPEDEARGLTLGAADYIQKPVRSDVLIARVEKVLASK
jgi:type II secretory ATPase GspE/PulE/Tfp pilus assembly ATPase PilB-like protein/DNA-binding response OmpR family regulator